MHVSPQSLTIDPRLLINLFFLYSLYKLRFHNFSLNEDDDE